MNERVGGREQFVHPIAKAADPNPRLAGERLGEPPPERLVPPGETDNHRRRQLQARPRRSREVADPPAAAGDDDHPFVEGQGQFAPRLFARAGLEECGRDERPDAPDAPNPGHPLDGRDAGSVHHQVEVDPAVSPELESGKIGGGGTRRHRQASLASEIAEHARCRRIGRDDDVRPVALDQPQQRACAEQRKARPPQTAKRGNASEEAIEKAEDPGRETELEAVGVEQDEAKQAAESNERVADQDLDVSSLADELGSECPRRGGVTLPDHGGEDDNP